MIGKVTFPVNNGYRHEATMYALKEIEEVAQVVEEAVNRDKEAAKRYAENYYKQFIPKKAETFIPMEDAVQSYAASHGINKDVTADLTVV